MHALIVKLLMIAAGGAVGAVARFGMAHMVQRWTGPEFPFGILSVNVLGCLGIGVLAAHFAGPEPWSEPWRLALMIGLLGGFTTFSAFSLESIEMAQAGRWLQAGMYILLTNALCLFATWAGYRAATMFAAS